MKQLLYALTLVAVPASAQTYDEWSRVAATDVVILGEVHDNPAHHDRQAEIVQDLAAAALVIEMLEQEDATALAADPAAFADRWAETGWPDFQMYLPIFLVHDGPIIGAAVPREVARATYADGVVAHFQGDSVAYGLTEALPEDQQNQRIELQFQAHCEAMPREMMGGMIEVQRLRDATLAAGVVQAVADTGGPVVVITGNGHARRDWGVPAYLARIAPELRVISVGQGEDGVPPEGEFDFVLNAPAPDRPDPCAQLK
ncbi:ChaN family lipoprotein [Aliiroseovarius sp. PrR006]|uniref:ChaN family lipoprotein n=1 Tax=Aliiroseovarius sp. PrR006 TaxID=2706883 RepID=UPI0013D29700|nr:ChaN family lipoprotein [Aliiroseovarius sp. PrR006]NDW53102.1 ChaN family lipoprotein [Aliiroseovarius sp. PrR006]